MGGENKYYQRLLNGGQAGKCNGNLKDCIFK
jgi:hypothetical protein